MWLLFPMGTMQGGSLLPISLYLVLSKSPHHQSDNKYVLSSCFGFGLKAGNAQNFSLPWVNFPVLAHRLALIPSSTTPKSPSPKPCPCPQPPPTPIAPRWPCTSLLLLKPDKIFSPVQTDERWTGSASWNWSVGTSKIWLQGEWTGNCLAIIFADNPLPIFSL